MNIDWRKASRQLISSNLISRTTKTSANSTDRLCAICIKHDFRSIFALAPDPPPRKIWEARYPVDHAVAHSETCPFCRLLCQVTLALKPNESVNGTRKNIYLLREYDSSFTVVVKSRKWHVPCLHVDSQERIQLIYQPRETSRQLPKDRIFRARALEPLVDVNLLQHWLEKCKNEHVECWKTKKNESKKEWMEHHIRLIDLDNNCVVEVTEPCEYVALSYVWGGRDVPQLKLVKSTAQRLFTKGGLSSSHADVPSTISDAIEISRRIGKKYLWVDAVCIMQDDREDQSQQINQMQKIYLNALFTIVECSGYFSEANSWTGLPGVRKARDVQKRVLVQGLQLANLRWHFASELNGGAWSYRAWTYQELQFSNCLIFFTRNQVFYRCDEALWREDQHLECDNTIEFKILDTADSTGSDPEGFKSKQKLSGTDIDAFTLYKKLAGGICSRILTNQNDILAAFAGISNALGETMCCDFIWGLPSKYFDSALLFQSTAGLGTYRRKSFPSWSWCGWLGSWTTLPGVDAGPQTDYHPDEKDHQTYAEIEWHIFQDGKYNKISNTGILQAQSFRELDTTRSLWRSPQLIPLSDLVSPLSKQEMEQLLVFQTASAFIRIQASSLDHRVIDTLFSADGTFRTINIRRNAPALIQRKMAFDTETAIVEFIVVGTIAPKPEILTKKVVEKDQKDKRVEGHLSLMAIETNEDGISQRIGVVDGKVDVQEWVNYKPEWRTVFLL